MGLADYFDDVGFTELALELGPMLPDGASVAISQVEASTSTNTPIYFPDTNNTEFAGKTFSDESGIAMGTSSHATTVGRYFYGLNDGLARGISSVEIYNADTWLNSNIFSGGPAGTPAFETAAVQNHSWIGGGTTSTATLVEALMRLDYMVERDGVVCVVGVNNGSANPLPILLSQSYNSIAVGVSTGNHSHGETVIAEAGRIKPEIVAPLDKTSWASPLVSSAAAMLLDHAGGALDDRPQVTKAILLAGATKHDVVDWDRTFSRPLDETFGAGELNIYRSYHILNAGEQGAATNLTVDLQGWDFLAVSGAETAQYFFDVPEGFVLYRFSAIATWHRLIGNGPASGFDPIVTAFSNVDLAFRESAAFVPGALVDLSTSQVDNVEHIYQGALPEGQYVLELSADDPADVGLAWIGELVKLPTTPVVSVDSASVAHITFDVSEGFDYRIEATSGLNATSDWQTIFSGSSNTNILDFMDNDAALYSERYYRFAPAP